MSTGLEMEEPEMEAGPESLAPTPPVSDPASAAPTQEFS